MKKTAMVFMFLALLGFTPACKQRQNIFSPLGTSLPGSGTQNGNNTLSQPEGDPLTQDNTDDTGDSGFTENAGQGSSGTSHSGNAAINSTVNTTMGFGATRFDLDNFE